MASLHPLYKKDLFLRVTEALTFDPLPETKDSRFNGAKEPNFILSAAAGETIFAAQIITPNQQPEQIIFTNEEATSTSTSEEEISTSEKKFKEFCNTYTLAMKAHRVGLLSASLVAVRGTTAGSTALNFILPTTVFYGSKSNPIMCLLTIIFDLGTLIFRVLNAPLLKKSEETPLFVDIDLVATKNENGQTVQVATRERIFLRRYHESQIERSFYKKVH